MVSARVPQPSPQLRQSRTLAVHQDANAIDARRETKQSPCSEQHERDAEKDLPHRRSLGHDAYEHQDGREEGHHGRPERERGIGVLKNRRAEDDRKDDGQHGWPLNLLSFLVGVHHGAERRVHCGV